MSHTFDYDASLRAFKFDIIHPHSDKYNFSEADSLISFAQKNKAKVHAHTLLWDAHVPYWVIWDSTGKLIHRKELDKRLKDHISTIVNRYKGKVYSWDVVNEALYDNDKEFYKPSWWYKIMGEDYIFSSYKYAHAADSAAKLYYNDYGLEIPVKREKLISLILKMRENNVPIHGIGIQGHWNGKILSLDELEQSIIAFSNLGLEVRISELSLKGYDSEDEMISKYVDILNLANKHADKIKAVVFWRSEQTNNPYAPLLDINGQPDSLLKLIRNVRN